MDFSKTAAVLLLTGSLAFAQGLDSGKFYIGANLGLNIPTIDAHSNDDGGVTDITLGKTSGMYGLHLGWRTYIDKSFHGVEFSFKDSNGEGNYKIGTLGGSFYTNESYELSYKGGYEFTPKTYLTGRVGYGWVDVEHSISGSSRIRNGTFGETLNIFILGAGIEHAITSNINVTAEYNYRFGDDTEKRHMYLNNSGKYTDIKGKFTDHSLLIGINYLF